jgi:hypothetical protein
MKKGKFVKKGFLIARIPPRKKEEVVKKGPRQQ